MGAAQSSMRPAGMVLPVSYLGELGSEIQYEKSMGSSRFLKSIKARHRSGALVIKVFVKLDSHMDLRPTSKRIAAERAALADCPNVLPYSQALATERAGYLIRQWLASNLYDRISTRPFLTLIEKKWIAFQLLTALKDVHARKVSHGDIKSENILVTSWNWVFLTDFSSAFKPTYIPEDDPSDFSYFFDTSGRRTCYLAPERFYGQDSDISRKKATLEVGRSLGKVTEPMDVFSLGCVIAELFMEGTPPFTLAQLLQYRNGDYSLDAYLAQIEDDDIRNLIKSMTSLEPASRLTCEQYYADAYDQAFPASFYDYFHDLIASTNEISAVNPAQATLSRSAASVSGTSTPQLGTNANNTMITASMPDTDSELPLPTNADEIIGRIWADFEQIERRLDSQRMQQSSLDEQPHVSMPYSECIFPVRLSIPSSEANLIDKQSKAPSIDGSAIIILSLVCANIRSCAHASSILRAFDILLAISKYLTDETKLDRMLPFVVSLLQNDAACVRAAALRTLTQTLIAIETITPSDAAIFPQYILPNVVSFANDPDESVRCVLAQSLPSLAEAGQWYLDMTQAMKAEGTFKLTRAHDFDGAPYEMSYDASLLDLQGQIQDLMNILLIDPSSSVRRSLVLNITPLCAFLGRARTADVLGLMTTHLNDRDWRLRAEFFGSMVGVSTCISVKSVDEYVLPLLAGALADTEEQVTSRELSSLSTLTSLGIHQKKRLWEALLAVLPLLYHPNIWIRSGAASFVTAAAKQLSETERWCCLYPGLRKLLLTDISVIEELDVLSALPAPLSRQVYEAAVSWASRSPGSSMWQTNVTLSGVQLLKAIEASVRPPILANDDKAEMQRMNTLGMTESDSYKLLALRSHIRQVAITRKNASTMSLNEANSEELSFADEIMLANLGIVPQNIIFSTTDNLGARIPSRASLGNGRTRLSPFADNTPGPSLDHTPRIGATRSVSGSSTADALRRRLAMTNTSSTSVNNLQGASSPRQNNLTNRAVPGSPGSAAASDHTLSKDGDMDTQSNAPSLLSSALAGPSSLTRQRSRVNMHGVELSKASAAVGADTTVAVGHLTSEAPPEAASISGFSMPAMKIYDKSAGGRFHSTYEGNDPAVKQMLDGAYLDSYREPMPEFGPFVPDKISRKRLLRPGARERMHKYPEGTLIGNLAEHTEAVTGIAVAPDHLFFVTGSADGNVKVWDTTRLEKNVTSRSRQTIAQGGRITSVTALENSHCVASSSTNGSIWVSRIDVYQQPGQMPRYGKPATIRQHLVDSNGDYATAMLHYDTDAASKLVYGTVQSKIVILDVRTLRIVTSYQQPTHLGPISCMCLDRKHSWLLTGTLSGYLTLWDLRFGLLLRTWKVGSERTGSVQSCTIHATKGKGRWVIVTIDGSEGFETWDVGTAQRVERFLFVHDISTRDQLRALRRRRASSAATHNSRGAALGPSPVSGSAAQAIEQLLSATSITSGEHQKDGNAEQEDNPAAALHGSQHKSNRPAVKVILNGIDYGSAMPTGSAISSLPPLVEVGGESPSPVARRKGAEQGWIISAGEDKRLLFWDLANVEKSSVIVGAEDGEEKSAYGREQLEGMDVYTETRISAKGASSTIKRHNLTAGSQQNLLKAHQDAITAVALLDLPFRCVVSADRSGNIKVWE